MADRAPHRAGVAGPGGLIRPMLATSGPVPSGPGWAFEVKFDGVRAIGYAGPGDLALYSRNDRDISRSYPEVAALHLEAGLVVDGERSPWMGAAARISGCCSSACTSPGLPRI